MFVFKNVVFAHIHTTTNFWCRLSLMTHLVATHLQAAEDWGGGEGCIMHKVFIVLQCLGYKIHFVTLAAERKNPTSFLEVKVSVGQRLFSPHHCWITLIRKGGGGSQLAPFISCDNLIFKLRELSFTQVRARTYVKRGFYLFRIKG